MTGPHVRVELAPPRPLTQVTDASHRIAQAYDDWRSRIAHVPRPAARPRAEVGHRVSRHGLSAPIGFADGRPVSMVLADTSPHALIGGPSGSGKTNLLLIMISSLAARYSPHEVEFYLLDFKEGVSFAQFAPGAAAGDLAAARQADRRQRQHRPGVRAGPAAVPVRRDAPARHRGEGRTG